MLLMHDVRKKTIWQMVGEWLRSIDIPMLLGLLTLMGGSLLILRSAGSSDEGILMRQTLRFAAAFGVLLAILGYAIGTAGGYLTGEMMRLIVGG